MCANLGFRSAKPFFPMHDKSRSNSESCPLADSGASSMQSTEAAQTRERPSALSGLSAGICIPR
eukprot:8796181-Alexandrium_andersonii.AAC.1